MIQKFTVPGRLPGFNEISYSTSWQKANRIKKQAMDDVMWAVKGHHLKPVSGRVDIDLICYEPNTRRDWDNVTSGANKIILDALQHAGILAGDGQKYIHKVSDIVDIDRENPRIEVTITEWQDGR